MTLCEVLAVSGAAPVTGFPASGESAWRLVRQLPLDRTAQFTSVSAASDGAVFAVGFRDGGRGPVALRWDGKRWSAVTAGLPRGTARNTGLVLSKVAAASASDAWAVGSESPCCDHRLYHWDGRAWREHLGLGPADASLARLGVAATGRAWLAYVPLERRLRAPHSVVMNWDGRRWVTRHLPPARQKDVVTTLQPADDGGALVVTTSIRAGIDAESIRRGESAHVLRWQGSSWRSVPLPMDTQAAAMTSSTEMWAAGVTCVRPEAHQVKLDIWERRCAGGTRAWARRWDGRVWRLADLPPVPDTTRFTDFTGTPPGNLWLSGTDQIGDAIRLRHDGRRWIRVGRRNSPDGQCREIREMTAVPGTRDLIAVGTAGSPDEDPRDGPCATVSGLSKMK